MAKDLVPSSEFKSHTSSVVQFVAANRGCKSRSKASKMQIVNEFELFFSAPWKALLCLVGCTVVVKSAVAARKPATLLDLARLGDLARF